MTNTFRQDVITSAETLIKADVAFGKRDKAQGVARLELAMALALFVSRIKPSLVIDKNDKNSWRKEFGLDELTKSSRAKVTQQAYHPKVLEFAKQSQDVRELLTKLDKEFSVYVDKDAKQSSHAEKDLDATTFRGLSKALPKNVQDKPDLENKLNQESDGASKVFMRIARKLANKSTAQLLEIEKVMDGQDQVGEDELHIPNPATIEKFSKSLPSTVSNWMK
tara:strand:+ start:372 stop:1037 length:666 start_codon:yes stop_codon:yes gene_type:complete